MEKMVAETLKEEKCAKEGTTDNARG